MISLYTKIPKDLHFLGLSNFSSDMLIPLACNFQSVLSAEAPMDSFCNAIVSTFMFSQSQHWAFTNYVAYWFFRTLAQPVFWADSLLVNLCLYWLACSAGPGLLLTILLSPSWIPPSSTTSKRDYLSHLLSVWTYRLKLNCSMVTQSAALISSRPPSFLGKYILLVFARGFRAP